MNVSVTIFDTYRGRTVKAYTVQTDGMELTCIEYGCTITKLVTPDRNGKKENIVLGYDTIEEYVQYSPYFGAVIGRNAGRIANAQFEIDGVIYHLAKNDGENNLHGGPNGFHQVIWYSTVKKDQDSVSIIFSYVSTDGEEGFPGTVTATVTYTITKQNELIIDYEAKSDQKTIINLTNHTYFNLSGDLKRTIVDHQLTLDSDYFFELDEQFIPTERKAVTGTCFDFRNGQALKAGIFSQDPQIQVVGQGYDHPFLLSGKKTIMLIDQESGRKVEVQTEEPCVVLYTGNSLSNDFSIRGRWCEKYLGVCLETQKPPNQINQLIVDANETYRTWTKYTFTTI